MEEIKHYCGVLGIWGAAHAERLVCEALPELAHRGQESTGVTVLATPAEGKAGELVSHREMGLPTDVLTPDVIAGLPKSRAAVGHVRYSTSGEKSDPTDIQPLVAKYSGGEIAIAHNGNLIDTEDLRKRLIKKEGAVFSTCMDTEVIPHLLAREQKALEMRHIADALLELTGSYSLVMLTKTKLMGVRDPYGFRPLSIGVLREGGHSVYVFASETCAFDAIGAKFLRDVEPGEIAWADSAGLHSYRAFPVDHRRAFCVFEVDYFMRPDSETEGVRDDGTRYRTSVYEKREALGAKLADERPIEADIVVPVPDSGIGAAIGYANATGIPIRMALMRKHNTNRSFITPTESGRVHKARQKLSLIRNAVKGLRVVLVDDSIVRGTTMRNRVKEFFAAGAREVHVLASFPAQISPCYYGVDLPDKEHLFAAVYPEIEIRREILGATSLYHISPDGMAAAIGLPLESACTACFTGIYPTDTPARA